MDADITSVFDHSVVVDEGGSPVFYSSGRDDTVMAFTGLIARRDWGVCQENEYQASRDAKLDVRLGSSSAFYTGTSECKSKFLTYDGHPGYDYKLGYDTELIAAVRGAVRYDRPTAGGLPPERNHTLTIEAVSSDGKDTLRVHYLHLATRWNGSEVLHESESGVEARCESCPRQGDTADPADDRTIGFVGDFINGVRKRGLAHLHLEVELNGRTVDPYGWQGGCSDPYPFPSVDLWQGRTVLPVAKFEVRSRDLAVSSCTGGFIGDAPIEGGLEVDLVATSSSETISRFSSWLWLVDGDMRASTQEATVSLLPGRHEIALIATTDDGTSSVAHAVLSVGDSQICPALVASTQPDGATSSEQGALDSVLCPPAAPTELNAVSVSPSRIDLSWKDNAINESGTRIERCSGTNCADFEEIGTVGPDVSAFSAEGLSAATWYTFRVQAFNSGAKSGYSATDVARTHELVPDDPMVVTAPATNVGQVGFTMNGTVVPNGAATAAYFEWSDLSPTLEFFNATPPESIESGASAQAVSHSLVGRSCGTRHYFRVVAERAGRPATRGAVDSVMTTECPAVSLSANPSAIAAGESSTLTWGSSNAGLCVGSWAGGQVPTTGSATVSPDVTTTYRVVCQGLTSNPPTATDSARVTVASDPTAITGSASGVSQVGFTMTGRINPNGVAATGYFEWSHTSPTLDAFEVTAPNEVPADSNDHEIAATLSGGLCGTTYYYRAVATRVGGAVSRGNIASVTTVDCPTITLTASPSAIRVGESSNLTWSTSNAGLCVGDWAGGQVPTNGTTTVSPSVTTAYHVVCQGISSNPPSANASVTVTVASDPGVTTGPATAVTQVGFTMTGIVHSNGIAVSARFQWSSSSPSLATFEETPPVEVPVGSMDRDLSYALSGALCGTTYYYRIVVARDGGPETRGEIVSVATIACPTASLAASPTTIDEGQSSTLSWSTTNAGLCVGSWAGGQVPTNGSASVSPTASTTYYIVCQGINSNPPTVSDSVRITVEAPTFRIFLSVSPSGSGAVSGAGTFTGGTSRTVTASANPGYEFDNWTEGGTVVWSGRNYTFTLNSDRTLRANFRQLASRPNAPSNLIALALSPTQVVLSWSDNSDNETRFELQRAVGWGATYQPFDVLNANMFVYSDQTVRAGVAYNYRVRACNAAGCSSYAESSFVIP